MTCPKGNSEFCFPETLMLGSRGNTGVSEKQNSLFPAVPVTKCFVLPPNSKLQKNAKKSFALRRLAHIFTAVSRSTT